MYTLTCIKPNGKYYIRSHRHTGILHSACARVRGSDVQIYDHATQTVIFRDYIPCFIRPQAD